MSNWSPEQRAAIEARGQNLLVAAAAGSGKTSVLVQRIIDRILDKTAPVNVDALLVVTFTNAAAAEMRERIAQSLTAELAKGERTRYLERQLLLLNQASISTIHSFCQSVVRQYFYRLDLDPNFRIAGEGETALLRSDTLEALLAERYEQGDEAFLTLVDHYGDERDDSSLAGLILRLYEFARSQPWPEHWLRRLADAFRLDGATGIGEPWEALLADRIALELERLQHKLTRLAAEAARPGNPAAYVKTLEDDRGRLDGAIAAARRSWRELGAALNGLKFGKLDPAPGVDAAICKRFQERRNAIKAKVKELTERYFGRPEQEFIADMRAQLPLIETLIDLVLEFGRRFQQAKKAKGLVDFSDLEHYCLQVLLADGATPGNVQPSAVALALREKYEEVLVDEYQDTNGVQETILELVSRPDRPNRFMVGDVKQSIYRFRLAEPGLFLEKYNRYPAVADGSERRIDLAQNFRSRPGILAAVNFLFSQLMTPRAAEMGYGEAEALNPGPDYPPCDQPTLAGPVEVHLIDHAEALAGKSANGEAEEEEAEQGNEAASGDEALSAQELTAFEREAWLIVQRLKALKEAGHVVYDKHGKAYRPLAWRDIVILLRAVQGKAGVLLDVLRQAGIPAYADLDGGYFEETEVQVMLSLLAVIDNPRQDIHLAGVLRSPLVGLSAGDLAAIRLCKDGDLWTALTAALEADLAEPLRQKIGIFLDRLDRWRSLARRRGVAELIWGIYRETGYYDYVGGMPGGALRQANLRVLYDRARQYEATNFRGLFRFLRFLDRLRDRGADMAVARALGEGEDVVRVMSIHKSKGLEFPVVVLADLGKQLNLSDTKELVLCHKELGLGPKVIRPDLRDSYPTLARWGIEHKLTLEAKAEELRVLYVALTRAREKLILVGSVKKLADRCSDWCAVVGRQAQALPDALITDAKSYLDWLGPAIVRHPDGAPLRELAGCDLVPTAKLAALASAWQVTIHAADGISAVAPGQTADNPLVARLKELKPLPGGDSAWVAARLDWRYPHAAAVGQPAKLTVSEIKRRFALADQEGKQWYPPRLAARPRFIQAAGKLTAAEVGTAMHAVMQHLDLAGDISDSGVCRQLERLVAAEILLPEQAAAVDAAAIAAFFASPLGQRLLNAAWRRRELAFCQVLPAANVEPALAGTDETVFIQGVVDCLFAEPDGLVLIDYKTDQVKDGTELIKRYDVQLKLYAAAMEAIFRQPVKEIYLYVFSTGQTVPVGR
ncbi:helicase-exonuclease AddAB subunit AddA [Sporolituus thermophilus]|uniref:ATP-dependent helicase/nuclease subunit A n=1 Tax=Sporolituus thermophilus DSM 23256 TaxID=1123285 RepID=A0A1G7JZJ5_9FIRM|nr:helicase-exonuclease AddAB subunit AddA [Sporolituus thermophilus]SDF30161.1 DNA helicase/exodeoxyribonuclease V, subunit A [Sporolituus thermophilus DSM 23256]